MKTKLTASIATFFALTLALRAGLFVIDVGGNDRGWYDLNGMKNPQSRFSAYNVGETPIDDPGGVREIRSYMIFRVPDIGPSDAFTSASLRLWVTAVGYDSPDESETVEFFGATATEAEAFRGGTAGVSGFEDLGSGDVFGEVTVRPTQLASFVSTELNEAFLDFINANRGKEVVIGGAMSTLSSPLAERVFSGSSTATRDGVTLMLTTHEPNPVARPIIQLRPSVSGSLRLAWPAELENFVLQAAPFANGSGTSEWSNVEGEPSVVGNFRVMDVPFGDSSRLFRLRSRD
jgi:hypothetical protein